jgi:hypothetical protein
MGKKRPENSNVYGPVYRTLPPFWGMRSIEEMKEGEVATSDEFAFQAV